MSTIPIRDQIKELHADYEARTANEIQLDMNRERVWYEWITYRKTAPFTIEDLRRVIGWLKTQMREEKWHAGCLSFRNLIGRPDVFEENLSLALGTMKQGAGDKRKAKGSYKPLPEVKPEERVDPEEFQQMFSGLKRRKPMNEPMTYASGKTYLASLPYDGPEDGVIHYLKVTLGDVRTLAKTKNDLSELEVIAHLWGNSSVCQENFDLDVREIRLFTKGKFEVTKHSGEWRATILP